MVLILNCNTSVVIKGVVKASSTYNSTSSFYLISSFTVTVRVVPVTVAEVYTLDKKT